MNKQDEKNFYYATAEEWLKRWDNNEDVWSIEMGGLGPGYEQAIQIAMAEILRHLIDNKYNTNRWEEKEVWEHERNKIEEFGHKDPIIKKLGLSGAQWNGALNLAAHMYNDTPYGVMKDKIVQDRIIQIRKTFPIE